MKKLQRIIACLVLAMSFASLGFAQEIHKATDKKGNLCLEKNGKIIVKENFEKISHYDSKAGLIPAKLNGKWGFYDNDGKLVISHQYEGMMFQNPAALQDWYKQERMEVSLNGKKIFIDKTGKEVAAPEYEIVMETPYTGEGAGMGAGYFLKKDGKWALADKNKKPVTEFKYDKILGPIGVNPFVYKGMRDGQSFRLSATGVEEAAIESNGGNNNQTSNNDTKKVDKYKYVCGGCGAIEIMEGLSRRPSPNKTHCRSPKVKNSTSHSWDSAGKVK
ncbi:MAG: WG repeat-containing protein [Raineya sp.]|jgi:hypothetical protein|nr:WG repeat-containing protein [Raineya sp.]